MALCDTFEDTAVGSPPKSSLWTLVPASASGSAMVDATGAHGSTRSLKIVSPDRLFLRNTTAIGTLGPVAYVRFYLRLATTLADGHGAMIVTHPMMVDQYSQSNELRFGSQDKVFHWNTDSDAANIPDVGPNGDATSFKPAADTWYCVALTINTNGHLNASIDGVDVPGLTADGAATANIDQSWVASSASLSRYTMLADFNFGWQSYGGGALTLWYDDVALSATPISCP
jgi:polysaccharide lyase-like protein